jgi:hypothetical protein
MSDVVMSFTGPVADELALIYPTQHKEAEALGYPYADMLRSLSDSLLDGDVVLLVIGYGFRDDHINRLLDHALATNVALQAVVVDPTGFGVRNGVGFDFNASRAAEYVRRNDARIVGFAGEVAKFEQFATTVLPDVDSDEPSGLAISAK